MLMIAYAEVLDDFKAQESEIYILDSNIALEAENVLSSDDNTNKMNFTQSLKNGVIRIVKELSAIIQRFIDKIKQMFLRAMQTNKGFEKQIRTAIRDNKPLQGVKLISYKYDDNFLERQLNLFSKTLLSLVENINVDDNSNEKAPLDLKNGELYEWVFNKMGLTGSGVTSINTYFVYLKKNYRAGKEEILFTSSQTQEYYNIATKTIPNLHNVMVAKQSILSNHVNKIKSELNNIINNPKTQNDIKKKAMRRYSACTHIFNMLTSFLKLYSNFKIEKSITYRIVLKKLYHVVPGADKHAEDKLKRKK